MWKIMYSMSNQLLVAALLLLLNQEPMSLIQAQPALSEECWNAVVQKQKVSACSQPVNLSYAPTNFNFSLGLNADMFDPVQFAMNSTFIADILMPPSGPVEEYNMYNTITLEDGGQYAMLEMAHAHNMMKSGRTDDFAVMFMRKYKDFCRAQSAFTHVHMCFMRETSLMETPVLCTPEEMHQVIIAMNQSAWMWDQYENGCEEVFMCQDNPVKYCLEMAENYPRNPHHLTMFDAVCFLSADFYEPHGMGTCLETAIRDCTNQEKGLWLELMETMDRRLNVTLAMLPGNRESLKYACERVYTHELCNITASESFNNGIDECMRPLTDMEDAYTKLSYLLQPSPEPTITHQVFVDATCGHLASTKECLHALALQVECTEDVYMLFEMLLLTASEICPAVSPPVTIISWPAETSTEPWQEGTASPISEIFPEGNTSPPSPPLPTTSQPVIAQDPTVEVVTDAPIDALTVNLPESTHFWTTEEDVTARAKSRANQLVISFTVLFVSIVITRIN